MLIYSINKFHFFSTTCICIIAIIGCNTSTTIKENNKEPNKLSINKIVLGSDSVSDSTIITLLGTDTLRLSKWKDGKKNGVWCIFDSLINAPNFIDPTTNDTTYAQPNIADERFFQYWNMGVLEKTISIVYNEQGKLSCKNIFLPNSSRIIKENTCFHENGQILSKYKMINNQYIDTAYFGYENGSPELVYIYSNDGRLKNCKYYNESGKIESEYFEDKDGNTIFLIKDGKPVK